MHTSHVLQENLSRLESLSRIVESADVDAYVPENDARQLYWYGMEDIREKICGISEGQDRVVISQLWELGKKSPRITPTAFPALAMHGFIMEHIVEGCVVWEPYSPYLKDFWWLGIQVSNGHGFLLQPEHVFQANLQAALQMNL